MPPEVIDLLAHMSATRAVCLALWLVGSGSTVVLLAANTDHSLDPRPVLHQAAVHAGHDLNRAYATTLRLARTARRQTALTAAALLILTIPTGDHR